MALQFPNMDPVLIHLGPLAIRWYALAYIGGLLIGWWLVLRMIHQKSLWKNPPFNGKPPATDDDIGDLVVWDSLAILEYSNERWLDGAGWPRDIAARALARAVSAEMHSGFQNLRTQCPMDCVKRSTAPVSAEVLRDIERIGALWRDCRARYAAALSLSPT